MHNWRGLSFPYASLPEYTGTVKSEVKPGREKTGHSSSIALNRTVSDRRCVASQTPDPSITSAQGKMDLIVWRGKGKEERPRSKQLLCVMGTLDDAQNPLSIASFVSAPYPLTVQARRSFLMNRHT